MATPPAGLTPLELLYTQTWIRTAEQYPEQRRDAVKASVAKELQRVGIPEEIIIDLQRTFQRQQIVSQYGGLLNPTFIEARTDRRLYYLIEAWGGKFLALQAMLHGVQGDLSTYSTYGLQDSIVSFYGTDKEAGMLFDSLEQARFRPTFIEVANVHYIHGYKPRRVDRTAATFVQSSENALDKLIVDYWDDTVSDTTRQQLQDLGVLLGPVITEDLRLTGRIKAFVGINLVGRVPRKVTENIVDYLLGQGDPISRCIRSIFSCEEGPYKYLLYLVCNSPYELDIVTDALNKHFPEAKYNQ